MTLASSIDVRLRGFRGALELDLEVSVPKAGISVVFGRSGAGKTTFLRCLAGLDRLTGEVRFGTERWQSSDDSFTPTERRRIGMVFQEGLLFPHLSVAKNLEYAASRVPPGESNVDVRRVEEWLGLGPLLNREPRTLSAGERQRVAIGRALASSPRLLLMDEPLSSLDAGSKAPILRRLREIPDEWGVPLFYVTHSIDELAELADRVLWMGDGRLLACGAPCDVLTQLELAGQLADDAGGLLNGTVADHDAHYHLSSVATAWGTLSVPGLVGGVGYAVRLWIRARDVSLSLDREARTSILNLLPAEVIDLRETTPGQVLIQLRSAGPPSAEPSNPERLLAAITTRSRDALELAPGTRVFLRVKSVSLR
jgi:molybdate transport system ATP-binding protein